MEARLTSSINRTLRFSVIRPKAKKPWLFAFNQTSSVKCAKRSKSRIKCVSSGVRAVSKVTMIKLWRSAIKSKTRRRMSARDRRLLVRSVLTTSSNCRGWGEQIRRWIAVRTVSPRSSMHLHRSTSPLRVALLRTMVWFVIRFTLLTIKSAHVLSSSTTRKMSHTVSNSSLGFARVKTSSTCLTLRVSDPTLPLKSLQMSLAPQPGKRLSKISQSIRKTVSWPTSRC